MSDHEPDSVDWVFIECGMAEAHMGGDHDAEECGWPTVAEIREMECER